MEVGHRGVGLMWQQYVALLRKNAILTWRHKRSASLYNSALAPALPTNNVRDPEALSEFNAIPPCEDKFFVKTPCYDFFWSGNSSSRNIASIVQAIMANNPRRPIPSNKVMSFKTQDDADKWLLDNPLRCPGALHFTVKNATVISYAIQTNSTGIARRGRYEDPTFKFQIPLQIAAEREIARALIGDPNFRWNVGVKEFTHPPTKTFSALGQVGPTFFLAIAMFGFVFQISSLVTEKELKLRRAMSMMGLYESAYWLSWFTWEAMLTLISALLTLLFGIMFQFPFFKNNSFVVLFLLFFLFQLNMISFAFVISTLISKASSATTVGFSIFIIGFLTQLVTTIGFPYSKTYEKRYRIMWSLFPPNLFAKAVKTLSDATFTAEDPGIRWSSISKCTKREPDCVITIETIYKWLITTFCVWFILAIYLDNIIPNANGVRKSVFYFLNPGYWTGRGGSKVREGSILSWMGWSPPMEETSPTDEDVLAEEKAVKQQIELGDDVAVQVRGLTKTYPGTFNISCTACCCKCKRTSPYHSIKGIWVNLAKDQLFFLLGPNGAGKTTTISCLTGITPITGGDALIYGNSVRSSVGMANIRRLIGVCPQFDILWDALTAEENLALFASIKGLPPSETKTVVKKLLADVKLAHAAHFRGGSFSGGMKRRLSVAISLIGDPKLVFLDEPVNMHALELLPALLICRQRVWIQ
ncbi:ABC transporter A family member 2-like isoform X1 [Carex littledalei]|uniref:ABC transporter A family member 2-like isoform X1 n=1 Tax=Carex littledalei TaxID=544730 RepID=A0A833VY09_9POAL|nr:ABC transporter A family member 2-like isoform X1 [Carex littledalei]